MGLARNSVCKLQLLNVPRVTSWLLVQQLLHIAHQACLRIVIQQQPLTHLALFYLEHKGEAQQPLPKKKEMEHSAA